MHELLPKTPENAAEAQVKRQAYIGILQRCRGLEEEALMAIGSFVQGTWCEVARFRTGDVGNV